MAKQFAVPNRIFDSNGFPEAGATASLYLSGSLTPADFYADEALTNSLGSTITANSAGRFTPLPYQDEDVAFRVILKDANGNTLDDIDPFYFGVIVGVQGPPGDPVEFSLTADSSGAGNPSGITYNGSAAVTISYNTVGAAATSHEHITAEITDLDLSTKVDVAGDTMTGKLNTVASSATEAGLSVPHGAAPSAPTDGDVWTTTAGLFARINGSTVGPYTASAGGVADGDKGDITVSGSGATWTIDNTVVSYAKIQDVAANSVLARAASTSGSVGEVALAASQLLGRGDSGDIAAITLGSGLSLSGTTLSTTGSVPDGDKGDITVSGSGATWTIDSGAVTFSKIQDVAANSVLARVGTTTGSVSEVSLSASNLIGRGSSGNINNITLGVGLEMDGTELNATGNPRIQSTTSATTVTPTYDDDQVNINSLSTNLTLANWSGTVVDGHQMIIRIKDNGTSRNLNYGSQYRAVGVTLPTSTVANKTLYLAVIRNSSASKLDVVGVRQEV